MKTNSSDLDNLASKVLRAASMWGALESYLVPTGRGEGPGPTKVHADVSVDLRVSRLRSALERGINLAHSMLPTKQTHYSGLTVVKRAVEVAHNRYNLDTSSFYLMAVRALDNALQDTGEFLNSTTDKAWWSATSCRREGCSGTLGIIIRGGDSIAVCSMYSDHTTNLGEM